MRDFFTDAVEAIKANAKATVIDRPYTSGALVLVGVVGTLVLQWAL